ncbi:MAG: hypothetical protein WC139_09025 [Candidatus Kapaibacterium sp.]
MKLYVNITIVLMLISSVLFAQRYTTTDPITVTGSITEVNHPIAKFKADDGTVYEIHMGPYGYWLNNGITLNNESATIKGEVKTVNGVNELYPNEITQNSTTIKLADENGVPYWAGNKGKNGNGKGWRNGNKGNRGNCPGCNRGNGRYKNDDGTVDNSQRGNGRGWRKDCPYRNNK